MQISYLLQVLLGLAFKVLQQNLDAVLQIQRIDSLSVSKVYGILLSLL